MPSRQHSDHRTPSIQPRPEQGSKKWPRQAACSKHAESVPDSTGSSTPMHQENSCRTFQSRSATKTTGTIKCRTRRTATVRRANPDLIEPQRAQRDNRALPTLKQRRHQAACQGLHLQTPAKPGRQLLLAESTASGSGLPGSGGRFPPEAPGSSRPAWACPQS